MQLSPRTGARRHVRSVHTLRDESGRG
jgi:hypothetical protein